MSGPKRHRWLVVPRGDRPFPKRWTDWIRPAVASLAVVVLVLGVLVAPNAWPHVQCRDGWPGADIWQSGDECVGLTEGPYAFELAAFEPVLRTIAAQNRSAADRCLPEGTPVVVGVLLTMSDRFAGARAVHELEGMAAGQARANGTGCLHPMKLLVGQLGAYDGSRAPVEVARKLADRPEVVAVAGIGLSDQLSAEIADVLAAAKLPMVSDLITAEGFDQSGSKDDRPDFDSCDPDVTYPRGVGKDHFYRVAFRAAVQIDRLAEVVARPHFIMVPTGGSDPYTCTALPLMQRAFGGDVTEVMFYTDDGATVSQTARRVCGLAGDVRMAYIARGRDLARFLFGLDEAFANGQCAAASVTVVSTSDGNRLRAAELDPVLEDLRVRALTSRSFTEGRIRLIATLVGGADKEGPDTPGFAEFEQAFTGAGFDIAHADAGWAVNAYDAVTTISAALRRLPVAKAVQRSQVNIEISGFSSPEQSVPGAGGRISFDNSGNRTGGGPPVVRVCPMAPGAQPGRVPSVPVLPGEPLAQCT